MEQNFLIAQSNLFLLKNTSVIYRDKYIAKRETGEEDDNFLKKIENLLTDKGHEITFSEITK